jgi:hypothetical protein
MDYQPQSRDRNLHTIRSHLHVSVSEPGGAHVEQHLEVAQRHLKQLRVGDAETKGLVNEQALEGSQPADHQGTG